MQSRLRLQQRKGHSSCLTPSGAVYASRARPEGALTIVSLHSVSLIQSRSKGHVIVKPAQQPKLNDTHKAEHKSHNTQDNTVGGELKNRMSQSGGADEMRPRSGRSHPLLLCCLFCPSHRESQFCLGVIPAKTSAADAFFKRPAIDESVSGV